MLFHGQVRFDLVNYVIIYLSAWPRIQSLPALHVHCIAWPAKRCYPAEPRHGKLLTCLFETNTVPCTAKPASACCALAVYNRF